MDSKGYFPWSHWLRGYYGDHWLSTVGGTLGEVVVTITEPLKVAPVITVLPDVDQPVVHITTDEDVPLITNLEDAGFNYDKV